MKGDLRRVKLRLGLIGIIKSETKQKFRVDLFTKETLCKERNILTYFT